MLTRSFNALGYVALADNIQWKAFDGMGYAAQVQELVCYPRIHGKVCLS